MPHNLKRFIPIIYYFWTRFLSSRLLLWLQNLVVNLATPLDTNNTRTFAALVRALPQIQVVRHSLIRKR
jgi:hypothetical protein